MPVLYTANKSKLAVNQDLQRVIITLQQQLQVLMSKLVFENESLNRITSENSIFDFRLNILIAERSDYLEMLQVHDSIAQEVEICSLMASLKAFLILSVLWTKHVIQRAKIFQG